MEKQRSENLYDASEADAPVGGKTNWNRADGGDVMESSPIRPKVPPVPSVLLTHFR